MVFSTTTSNICLEGTVKLQNVAWCLGCISSLAFADGIPTTDPLTYTGHLLDSAGAPVRTAQLISLSLWDDPSSNITANRRCDNAARTITPDANGRFQLLLDGSCLAAVQASPNLWVQVTVGATLLPRVKLGAVPYAVEADRARVANTAGGSLAQQVVPPGAVMAFDLPTCPAGWTELTAARGRTLVGTNPDTSNGLRVRARNAQFGEEDHLMSQAELVSHRHIHSIRGQVGPFTNSDTNLWPLGGSNAASTFGTSVQGEPTGNSMPFNVTQPSLALLYCRKS
jgi:hypothetical protein